MTRVLKFIEGGSRMLAGLLPDDGRPPRRRDVARTVRQVCDASYRRSGLAAMFWTGLLEWVDIIRAAVALRWERETDRARRSTTTGPRDPGRSGMFIDDVRHAFRRLRGRPASLAAAIGMLALGIGLTAAMFTVLDALMFRPIPFHDPQQLARVSMFSNSGGRSAVAPELFRAWQRTTTAFTAVEAAAAADVTVTTPLGPEVRPAARVSIGLFEMLGVKPIRGRTFVAGEGRPGSDDRVLISEDLWRSRFGKDAGIVGRRIALDGQSMEVVGVMPDGFRFPAWNTAVWTPADYSALPPGPVPAAKRPVAFVRFSPALPQKDALQIATDVAHDADPSTVELRATPLPLVGLGASAAMNSDLHALAPLLAGGAGLVLLVLCANVSSLLLVRLIARKREFGVCAALGATRGRLLRQTLIEHAAIGLLAAGAGLSLAWLFVSTARGVLPDAILVRTLNPIDLDWRALGVTAVAGLLASLLGGLVPAWLGTNLKTADAIRISDRGSTDSRGARLFTRGLLMAETALACMLLVGATVLVSSFVKLARADRGLDTRDVLTSWIVLPAAVKDGAARQVMATTIEEQVASEPGVARVALSFGVPPDGGGIHFGQWSVDGEVKVPDATINSFDVGPDFFELYRIPIVRGRTFQAGDGNDQALVGARLAQMFWPGQDPIGHTFRQGGPQSKSRWLTVVGIVGELRLPSLDPTLDRPQFYQPFVVSAGPGGAPVEFGNQFMLNIKCGGPCPDLMRIRERIAAGGPGARVVDLGPLEKAYQAEIARPRATAVMAMIFAGIAVAAAAGGLFSVLSYVVGRRRQEFGVRAALGAEARQLRGLVFRDGLTVAAAGSVIGMAGGWMLSRWIESLAYGVRVRDPYVWVIVLVVIVTTVLASCWRPARQAGRVDPAMLLRDS